MYNLHCHSLLSDGCLLPSELAMRYMAAGYKAIAITDHADYSNIEQICDSIVTFTKNWPKSLPLKIYPGVELTHLPPEQFEPLAVFARKMGIRVIVAHGQSPVEPVIAGTNKAALEADIDILAHPGMITDSEVQLAKKNGIFLEITSRRGHNQTNAHVAKKALKFRAKLILNHDSHDPDDITGPRQLVKVGLDAGLTTHQIDAIYKDVSLFLKSK